MKKIRKMQPAPSPRLTYRVVASCPSPSSDFRRSLPPASPIIFPHTQSLISFTAPRRPTLPHAFSNARACVSPQPRVRISSPGVSGRRAVSPAEGTGRNLFLRPEQRTRDRELREVIAGIKRLEIAICRCVSPHCGGRSMQTSDPRGSGEKSGARSFAANISRRKDPG